MDAVMESRILKNLRAHRVPGGICADVSHCQSGLWSCIECEHYVPEVEQLPYFKEQLKTWEEKMITFANDKQLQANFDEIAKSFRRISEKLEGQYGEDR
jgi:hypothetical protein